MVDNITIKTTNKSKKKNVDVEVIEPKIEPHKPLYDPFEDEKVEVLIKEVVRIKPKDFQAFKHALEHFVKEWE